MPNTFLKFFSPKKPIPFDLNLKNWFWAHIYTYIYGSIKRIVSKSNRVRRTVDPQQPC